MTLSDSHDFFRQSAKNLLEVAVALCGMRYGVIQLAGEAPISTDARALLPLHDSSGDDLLVETDDAILVTLLDATGARCGTLAVLGNRARSLTDIQKGALLKIAAEVMRGLDRAQMHFRALADGAPVPIFASRLGSGRLSYVNHRCAETLGYSVDEVLALENVTDLVTLDQRPMIEELRRRREGGDDGDLRYETKVRRRDGTILEAEIHTAIIEAGGEPLVIGVAIDSTDRKRAERQLAQVDRLTSLGRLSAQVAHEFNNVMMGILPLAEGIRRRAGDDPALLRFTDLIASSLQRGKRLTTDILRFGRPAQLALGSVDVAALLRQTAEEVRPLLGGRIELEVACEEELFLLGDAAQLTQVLMNLALNARDAMDATANGRLSIAAERADSLVHITVRDNGSGIAPEDLPYIFEPLFTTKNRGTGLGLSVAFQVVAAHEGQILAESPPGEGTTFHIFIPGSVAPAEEVERRVEPADGAHASLSVLIVEDDEAVGTGLRWFLEGEGMDVRVVMTGAAVMPAIAERRPDVIILDLSLPDQDGRRIYKRIRSEHSIPVIFSSGHATEGDIDDLIQKPRAAFLMKPYRTEDLLKTIRSLARD